MKNVYVGAAVLKHEIQRMYVDPHDDEKIQGSIWMFVDDGIFKILLYEDADSKIPNNPFSDITDFPLNVSFSFDKLISDKDFVYNLWEIDVPIHEIERIIEEFEDDTPGHDYTIILKNGSQIKIIGKRRYFNLNQDYKLIDHESLVDDLTNVHPEVYNKIQISCETTEKEILINYLKKRIESYNNYIEAAPNRRHSVATNQRIKEYKNEIKELEDGD